MRHLLIAFGSCVLLGAAALAAGPVEWSQFRGPGGAGVADGATLPEHWSVTDKRENVAWVAEIPGRGWSSPILWRDRLFVTSAVSAGAFKAPSKGIFGNDYAAELEKAGSARSRDRQARGRTRYRARRRNGRDQLHGLRAGCEHRTDHLEAGSPRGSRSAAGTERTPTPRRLRRLTASVSTRRSAETSASSATHSTARFCGRTHGRRSRSTWTSALRPHRSCTTDGSTSCTTTMDSRFWWR